MLYFLNSQIQLVTTFSLTLKTANITLPELTTNSINKVKSQQYAPEMKINPYSGKKNMISVYIFKKKLL